MASIPVQCSKKGCGGTAQVDHVLHGGDVPITGLTCSNGHGFDFDKHVCPECGGEADPAKWGPRGAWFEGPETTIRPDLRPMFRNAHCNDCGWEGPKGPVVP